MGKFDQVEFDSLAPYEQKQYEMDNPRQRVSRKEAMESSRTKMNSIASPTEGAEKAIEAYRAKVGSDSGGKTIRGGGSSGTGGVAADNKMLLNPRAMKTGGKVSQLSKANGIAKRGLTRGKMY